MSKTLFVAGYGPGISNAVAEKFGREGFSVALMARNAGKLEERVREFQEKGIKAAACPADAGDAGAVRAAVARARKSLGPIAAIHWNAATPVAGDILTAPIEEFQLALNVAAVGLVAAVQEALPDLRQATKPAILVTNGGFGQLQPEVDAMAVQFNSMGLAIGNAAKHKTVRLLAKRLEGEKIYVGEIMVMGTVKGTAWDTGNATLQASDIANRFWQLYTERTEGLTHFKA